ncbi:hypothetical protein [Planomicrobium sp. YIM 101495]|uniref:hypothetical protein n=1 Tax=Planomicrobium sp. YIM 101495 TaxID=2665160 RepID=UPI001E372EFB|nr:hypothetical protein [Planomicrobium sp. YIM 101495]
MIGTTDSSTCSRFSPIHSLVRVMFQLNGKPPSVSSPTTGVHGTKSGSSISFFTAPPVSFFIDREYNNSISERNNAKRYRHIGRIYQKRYFAKAVDTRLGLLTVSSYIHRNPIQTKVPMVERLELYPYSSFPLYWEETLPAPAFLDREVLRVLLPEPFAKTNTAYCMYCLTYD